MKAKLRKTTELLTALTFLMTIFVSGVAADPAQPPPPPPPEPPSGVSQSDYAAITTIKGCMTDFNSNTDTLEYCNSPHRQTKTKNIYFCDADGDSQYDSGEKKGSYDNPTPNCGSGTSYAKLKTEQREYITCGEVDAEDNPNVNKTTNVDETEWYCPAAKALSMRHEPGNLDAGLGISGTGYTSLDTMSYRSGNNMSYNVLAAVPACVNRVPMINLNVQMRDSYSGETTDKTGIYAAHMNLYYGPGGSKGKLQEIELPEQNQFRRQYTVNIRSNTYRMWAWRQRFAGAVQDVVQEKNLQLPEDVSVQQIAEQYRDRGKSVGDLWLSSDFLYGAEAGDPTTRQVEVTRQINTTCTVDVSNLEREFDGAGDFEQYVENNPQDAIDLIGKEGGNYCELGTNETLIEIRGSEPTGGYRQVEETLTGYVSTKILDNETGSLTASVDVRDLNAEFLNQTGQTEDVTTGRDFVYFYNNDRDAAVQELNESQVNWTSQTDLDMKRFTQISDVSNDDRVSGTLDATVDVRDLNATYINESDQEEKVNTSQEFMELLDNSESAADQEIRESKINWTTQTNLQDKRIDQIDEIETDGQYKVAFEADYTQITHDVSFTADYSRYMTGQEFQEYPNDYIESQLEKHVYGEDNDPSQALKPVERFEDKQIKVDGVKTSKKEAEYEGSMKLETVENVARDRVYVYTTYRKKEIAKKSWNWRALQGLTMTTLAKCMYNWDQCMKNKHDLPSRSWEATEVMDAGYGPWKQTNTFQWSSRAAARKGENLQDVVDDTDFYDQQVEVNFDKYYDGARGSTNRQAVPVNVYRSCESDMGWTSAEGEFYNSQHFICPDSTKTNHEATTADPSQVYRCAASPAQLPVEQADEYDARKIDGNWYVCRTASPGKWLQDKEKPSVYVQKSQKDNTQVASVACTDDVATCDESTYRMKIYEPGERPLECPESYQAYDTEATSKEIGAHRYVCATAKDKVGKVSFTPRPVEFGSEQSVQNLEAEVIYPSSTMKLPYGQTNHLFYEVTNQADEYRDVKVSLEGTNATFMDGSESKSFTLVEGETKEMEIKMKPAVPGTSTFSVLTSDQTVGYRLNDSISVRAPASIGGVTQGQGEERSVPGIGMIQILAIIAAATAYIVTRP